MKEAGDARKTAVMVPTEAGRLKVLAAPAPNDDPPLTWLEQLIEKGKQKFEEFKTGLTNAWKGIWGTNPQESSSNPSAVQASAIQTVWAQVTQTVQAVATSTPSPTHIFTPTTNPVQIYQQYKSGPLTPWEATIGGEIADNAHKLLLEADKYHFWGTYPRETNSYPPLAGVKEYKNVPMPTLTPEMRFAWGEIPDVYDYTGGKTPFVCGDIPDWSYFYAGLNLQELFPNVSASYPNRWARSSYGYLNMLYPNSWHEWDVKESPNSIIDIPELGDVMVLQFDNHPDSISGATHVVLVAEVYGNTSDKIYIIEGNPDDGTIVKHSVREIILRLPDLNYLIFGHPDLPSQ